MATQQQKRQTAASWAAAKVRLGLDGTRAEVLAAMRRRIAARKRGGSMPPKPSPNPVRNPRQWATLSLIGMDLPHVPTRGKNPVDYLPVLDSARIESSDGWTEWRNGRAKTYHRAQTTCYVLACGHIEKAGLRWVHQNPNGDLRTGLVCAPRGYHWGRDDLGIRLVPRTGSGDYHPTMADILAGPLHLQRTAAQHVRQQRQAAAQQRQAVRAVREQQEREAASWPAVLVCRADSYAAGNCAAGTEKFAANHGLDLRDWVPAEILLRIAERVRDRDPQLAGRILATCRRAMERQGKIPLLATAG